MPGVVYKISGDNSQFQKDVNQSENIAAGGFNKITALGIAAWAVIGAAIVKVTSAGVSFLKDSVNVGMGFDKSMSQVAATMGTTVDSIQDLSQFAMEMGATTAFSAQQAADGLNILAMSGLNAKDQIATLPDVLNLAASGGLSLAESAKYVTGAVKGFGDSFGNASYYTDLIATGAAKANTNVSQLGLALSDSAATSASYGQTAEGTTLALLRLAEQNVTGAEAATALNRAMMDLYTPTESAKKALDKLGVSAYDLTTGKARPLNDVIDDLTVAMDGMSDAEKNATKNAIFSTFGLQAYNKMTVSTKQKVNEFKKALDQSAGSAKKMAEVQLDNLAGDITIAKSAAEGLKIALSNSVTPAIRDFVRKGTTELTKLKAAFEQDGLSGLATQFGKSLAKMSREVIKYIPEAIKAGIEFGKALLSGITDSFDAGKIIQSASKLIKNLGDFLVKDAPNIGEKVGKLIADTLSNLPSLLEAGGRFITQLFAGMIQIIPELVNGVKDGFVGMFAEPVSAEAQAVYDELETMKKDFADFMEEIQDTAKIKDIETDVKYAEKWLDIWDELSKKTSLTREEQEKLNTAVSVLNEYLPKGTELVKKESGAWSLTREQIQLALEAKKNYALADVYLEKSKEVLREIVDQEERVTTESKKADDSFKKAFDKRQQATMLRDDLDMVYEGLYNWEQKGQELMVQDLPAPVKKLAEEWGLTGQVTRLELQAIIDMIDAQAAALEADAEAAKQEGEAHQQAAKDAQASIEELNKTYDEMVAKATNALDVAGKAESKGAATGRGFANGLRSMIKDVEGAASGLANAAVGRLGRDLAIKSPSKVTQKLGRYVTEGLAVGIGDDFEIHKVEQSATKAADAGISALTSSIDSSISANPVTGTENGKIDMIITLLTTYLPNMGGDVVLDTGALVGHTIGRTDAELGQLQKRRARYE